MGRMHHISWYGVQEESICPPYVNIGFLMHFQLSIIVLGNSASHFLEMTMLISKVVTCNLIQIRMEVGSVTFSNLGSCGVYMSS